MSIPILPLAEWPENITQASIPANDNATRLEILNGNVISQAVTAQPGSPAEGDTYIIASTHTGAQWAGFSPKDLAIYKGGTWHAFAPTEGNRVSIAGTPYKFTSGAWSSAGGSGTGGVYTRGATWSGGGSAVATPAEDVSIVCHTAGNITASTVLTDGGTGSCVIDVWKDTYANYPPTVADTITASAKPTISSSNKVRDTTLTGWTKTVAAGDILRFHLDSTSVFKNIHIELDITP